MSGKQPAFTPERLQSQLRQFPETDTCWVAFSGGADSTALLQALYELGNEAGAECRAVHVNHGLQPAADDWQRHCEEFCAARGIRLECFRITVESGTGLGREAAARRQRYEVAAGLLGAGEMLLTGHHSDDQAETVLLNLMRGSGVDGLAGMPALRPLGEGWLARPLLPFDGRSLRTFLEDRNIAWIEDDSNADLSYDRNYLRHSLLGALEQRWHRAADKIAESAAHCREAAGLVARLADEALAGNLVHPQVLSLERLGGTDPALFKQAVRRWLQLRQAPALPARRLEELSRQCSAVTPEHRVKLDWEGWVLQLYRKQLWLQPLSSIATCSSGPWSGTAPLDLGPAIGYLEIDSEGADGLPELAVGPRRGGERIHFAGSDQHKSVKHLLQDAGVPPWLRRSIPMLSMGGEPVALGDWAVGSRLRDWLGRHGAQLFWTPADPLLRLVHAGCRDRHG